MQKRAARPQPPTPPLPLLVRRAPKALQSEEQMAHNPSDFPQINSSSDILSSPSNLGMKTDRSLSTINLNSKESGKHCGENERTCLTLPLPLAARLRAKSPSKILRNLLVVGGLWATANVYRIQLKSSFMASSMFRSWDFFRSHGGDFFRVW